MAERRPLTRRIMRDFVIKELSAVDRPAQAGALAVIMKRDDQSNADFREKLRKAYNPNQRRAPKGSKDGGRWVDEGGSGPGGAHSTEEDPEFNRAIEQMEGQVLPKLADYPKGKAQEAALEAWNDFGGDATTAELVEQAREYLSEWGVRPRKTKKSHDDSNPEGDVPMTDTEKQIDALTKQVADLTKQLEAATAKDLAKKAADLQAQLDDVTKKLEALTKSLEKSEAEKADAIAKANMTDDEKACMEGMDDEARKEFMGMSPADRAKKMKKAADANPVVYKAADGTEFRKNDDPRLVAMAKRADESEKKAAEEAEKRETSELTKRAADTLGDFSDDIAKADAKVEVLRAISKMEEGPRKALEKMLEVGGKAIKAAFQTIGHKDGKAVAKTAADFNKRVDEIVARDKVTKMAALEKARVEFPAEFEAYQNSGAQVN